MQPDFSEPHIDPRKPGLSHGGSEDVGAVEFEVAYQVILVAWVTGAGTVLSAACHKLGTGRRQRCGGSGGPRG